VKLFIANFAFWDISLWLDECSLVLLNVMFVVITTRVQMSCRVAEMSEILTDVNARHTHRCTFDVSVTVVAMCIVEVLLVVMSFSVVCCC